jgi:hypothetical protein
VALFVVVPRAAPRPSYLVELQRHNSSHCHPRRHGMGTVATSSGLCACWSSVIREMKCHRLACQHSHAARLPQTWNPMPERDRFSRPHDEQITFPPRCCAFCRPADRGNCHSLGARVGSGGERNASAIKGLTTVHAVKMGPAANVVSPSARFGLASNFHTRICP